MKPIGFRNQVVLGLGALLVLFTALSIRNPLGPQFPVVVVAAQEDLRLIFLLHSRKSAADCAQVAEELSIAVRTSCRQCKIESQVCLATLNASHQTTLNSASVRVPLARLPNGVVIFETGNAVLGMQACNESERQSSVGSSARNLVTCFPPGAPRPDMGFTSRLTSADLLWALASLLFALATTSIVCGLIVRYEHLHAHFSLDEVDSGPQKFHAYPTPRIGGIGVFAGLLVGGGVYLAMQQYLKVSLEFYSALMLVLTPAFLIGISEDVTKSVGVPERLVGTMLSGSIGTWLLGATIAHIDLVGVDTILRWIPAGVVFTVFAVSGIANAINIIDGYNGLAVGFAVIVFCALAVISSVCGDRFIFYACLTSIGALLGFLIWNWPLGRIFLGDGGAYLIGILLAELSVLLVVRNPAVSPWFPLALLVYPVLEVLFSAYRKRLLRNHSPGHPDGLHMHMLIFKRLVRVDVTSRDAEKRTKRNSRVARYVWIPGAISAGLACVAWDQTLWLELIIAGFCSAYIWLYWRIVRFRAPKSIVSHR